jgi:hypothetical protein
VSASGVSRRTVEAPPSPVSAQNNSSPRNSIRALSTASPGLLIIVKMRRAAADRNDGEATAESPKSDHKMESSQAELAPLTKCLWNNCRRFHAHAT